MQEIWLPSTTPNSKALGRFVDIHDTYQDKAGNRKERIVTVLHTKIPGSLDVSAQLCKNNDDGAKLKAMYPGAWADYEKRKVAETAPSIPTAIEYGIKGAPIESADFIAKPRMEQLKLMGFYTLESLADMSDTICDTVGSGARKIRKQAREALAVPK